MFNQFTSDRGEAAVDLLEGEDGRGQGIQVLTPAETAQVSGGVLLLYWLLVRPAY